MTCNIGVANFGHTWCSNWHGVNPPCLVRSIHFANSRRIFPGPQWSRIRFTPRVMCFIRNYWFNNSVSSSRTRLNGASKTSKADRSLSRQWGSRLSPASWRGEGEVGLRDFKVGAAWGGSGTAGSLESSVLASVILISGPSLYTTLSSAIVNPSFSTSLMHLCCW